MLEKDLEKVAGGIFTQQLLFLQQEGAKIGPAAICSLLDPARVESAAEEQFTHAATLLEAVRNVLILLPILVTWLSLGLAAVAYAQIALTYPNQPFLKLWTDGFPGAHAPAPPFSVVAGLDVGLLLVLLTITLLIHVLEGMARYKAARLRCWLEKELLALTQFAARYSPAAGPAEQAPTWVGEVKDAMDHLTRAVTKVEGFVKASQDELNLLVDTSQRALENLTENSRATLEGASREFSRVLSDHRAAVNEFIDGTQDVRRAVDKLEVIYIEGQHIYRSLNQTMPDIQTSFKQMAQRQDEAAGALLGISGNNDISTKAVTEIAEQFIDTNLVGSTSRAASQMQATAQTVEGVARELGETVKQQNHLQQQLHFLFTSQKIQATRKKRIWWRPRR
ncbi:MAG TPA: hypothetical protein VGF67_02295 [Ktedonobacteraceae bacterium]